MKQNYHFLESMAFPNGAQVRNRIVMAPMTEMMAFHDGSVSSAEVDYMAQRSKGVGLLITPVAYINPEGKGFEGQLGVDADDKIPHLAKLAYGIKSGGAKAKPITAPTRINKAALMLNHGNQRPLIS